MTSQRSGVPRCVVCLLGLGVKPPAVLETTDSSAALLRRVPEWEVEWRMAVVAVQPVPGQGRAGFPLEILRHTPFSCTTFNGRRHPDLADRTCQLKQTLRECAPSGRSSDVERQPQLLFVVFCG